MAKLYTPDFIVPVGTSLENLGPAFVEAGQEMAVGYPNVFRRLQSEIEVDGLTGIQSLTIAEPGQEVEGQSTVMLLSYGNEFPMHNVVKGAYLYAVQKRLGMKTESGDPLPVVVIAAPGKSSGPRLSERELTQVGDGHFDPLSLRYLNFLESKGVTDVHNLVGSSYAGAVEVNMGAQSAKSGVRIREVNVGDPANASKKAKPVLVGDFLLQPSWKLEADKGGVQAYTDATSDDSVRRYFGNIAGAPDENIAIMSGLAEGLLEIDLRAALRYCDVNIAYGTRSKMIRLHKMREMIARVRDGLELERNGFNLTATEIASGHHTWENRIGVLAAHYSGSIRSEAA